MGSIVPWLSFGLAAAAGVAGWLVASYKSGSSAVYTVAMKLLEEHEERLCDLERVSTENAVIHQEIRSDLKYLRLGLERLEASVKGLGSKASRGKA